MSNIFKIRLLYLILFKTIFSVKLDSNKVNEVLLAQHNKYRKMHNAPDLVLDNELIKLALDYAAALAYKSDAYSTYPSGTKNKNRERLGENIFSCISVLKNKPCYDITSTKPVDEWYKEINNYNFEQPGFTIDSSHFTQIVWKETTKVGCGAALKDDDEKIYKVVCYYYKAGNILNPEKFKANVIEHSYNQIIIMNYFSLVLILFYLF